MVLKIGKCATNQGEDVRQKVDACANEPLLYARSNMGILNQINLRFMPLLYLKDNNNNTTAVVVPISDWEKITQAHQDINLMLQPKTDTEKKINPSDYRGCISVETADKLNAHIEQSRNEWNNDI